MIKKFRRFLEILIVENEMERILAKFHFFEDLKIRLLVHSEFLLR